MTSTRTGQIVWHDLFTRDPDRSKAFYADLAGWRYESEHATDFTWGGGENDYTLALSDDEAGAGFAPTPAQFSDGWIAYIEVSDVDATAAQADMHGGAVLRQPFEVPGVGRNALLRDPSGALIGVALSRHDYPVPRRQFGPEIYLSGVDGFPEDFYAALFDWTVETRQDRSAVDNLHIATSGHLVAQHLPGMPSGNDAALWAPALRVADLKTAPQTAEHLGARLLHDPDAQPQHGAPALVQDPNGAVLAFSPANS